MVLGYERSNLSRKSGLIFDAEGVTLIARYSDELSAYRARRSWVDTLRNYFLLEAERDFEMAVLSSPEGGHFSLSCFFISACGRYAFWRLINDQAPEAQLKLSTVRTPSLSSPYRGKLFSQWKTQASTIHSPLVLPTPKPRERGHNSQWVKLIRKILLTEKR